MEIVEGVQKRERVGRQCRVVVLPEEIGRSVEECAQRRREPRLTEVRVFGWPDINAVRRRVRLHAARSA